MFKLRTVDYMDRDVPELPTKVFPFIWYFARQLKWQLLAILILFGVSNVLVAVLPYYFKLFIEVFENTEDKTQIWKELSFVIGSFVALILVIQPIFAQLGNWLQAKTLTVYANMTRRQLALYMHQHSYGYFQKDFAGRLAGKAVETPSAMRSVTLTLIGAIWYAVVSFIVAIILFVTVHWVFMIIMMVWILFYALLLRIYIPKIKRLNREGAEARSIVRGRFVDTLTNILTVKLFARAQHEDEYLLQALRKTALKFQDNDLMLFRLWGWLEVLTTAFWIAVIVGVVMLWQQDIVVASDVALIFPLAMQVNQISWWMSEIFTDLFQRFGEIEEGMQALTAAHDVTDEANAEILKPKRGSIHFDQVEFSYDDKILFDGLDIKIEAGQKVGLVGHSGAGKSSLVQILLRLFDIDGGAIKIDGQDIAKVTQESLRSHIAVIPQASDMLHRSIAENIRYGRLNATDEDVIAAAKRANAHEFITELSDSFGNKGYQATVGERGVKLSGGQRQRVAIARAILKDAPILILDEATSALDSESERLIQESLFELMEGKTVLAIAHRLSTIAHLDRLLVMENGKIIEDGSHEELLEKGGYYHKLWSMQSFIGDIS